MKPSKFFKNKTGTFCLEDLEELDKRFIDRKEFERLIDKWWFHPDPNIIREFDSRKDFDMMNKAVLVLLKKIEEMRK